MATNKSREKLRVDFDLAPLTAIFTTAVVLGLHYHDHFLTFLGCFGLASIVGICVCERSIRKTQREIDALGGRS